MPGNTDEDWFKDCCLPLIAVDKKKSSSSTPQPKVGEPEGDCDSIDPESLFKLDISLEGFDPMELRERPLGLE